MGFGAGGSGCWANRTYTNIIVTGDMNAKSIMWGNTEINGAGSILEGLIDEENLIIMNDMLPTYRNSHSVIDLFLVKSHMNRNIKYCQTLTHENVRSDHIGVIMDLDDGLDKEEEVIREKYSIKKTDWQKWRDISEEKFAEWNSVNRNLVKVLIKVLSPLCRYSMNVWRNQSQKFQ